MSELELRYLPPILREMAGLIGLAPTLKIVHAYGGTRLYVPKRYDPEHPLSKLIGHALAVKFFEAFGGLEHFDIPKGEIAVKAARDRQIRAERTEGATHAALAIRYNLTERQIRNILGPEETTRQIDLF